MEYYGWDGKHDSEMTKSLLATYHALKKADIPDDIIIELNDSGGTLMKSLIFWIDIRIG